MADLLHGDITEKVIQAYYNVYNRLGFGFLEKVYENAMLVELAEMNISCERQKPIKVYYKQKMVGNYFADLLVEGRVVIELKAAEALAVEMNINS